MSQHKQAGIGPPPVLDTIRAITSLLLSYGLLLLANGLFGTLLGLRSKLEGIVTSHPVTVTMPCWMTSAGKRWRRYETVCINE